MNSPNNSFFSFTVLAEEVNARLDHIMARHMQGYSRSFLQSLICSGQVTVNGQAVKKSSTPVAMGATINVSHVVAQPQAPSSDQIIDIPIIAKTEHFLIINKPAGVSVHKGNGRNQSPHVTDWIVSNFAEISHVGLPDRPGIVHRIDKDTSGLLIIARTNYAHKLFSAMFKDRAMEKTYLAFVKGHPDAHGVIDRAIGRHPTMRHKMTVVHGYQSAQARASKTTYTVLEYFDQAALIEAHPITGRTHQIRVHFASIGHPLIGDAVYGSSSPLIARHALHASTLSFVFDGVSYSFQAPLPDDFKALKESLLKSSSIK